MSHPAFVRNLGACAIFAAISALSSEVVIAQRPTPPPGYFDIPAGFDFPAQKAVLEQFASSGNISAERTHAWNVFGGMTQPTPDGQYRIFETWYDENETFAPSTSVASVAPRKFSPHFQVPRQFLAPRGVVAPTVAGEFCSLIRALQFCRFRSHPAKCSLPTSDVKHAIKQRHAKSKLSARSGRAPVSGERRVA